MTHAASSASVVHTDARSLADERAKRAHAALAESTLHPKKLGMQVFAGVQYTVPYTLKVIADSECRPAITKILDECFEHTNAVLNNFNPDSEIGKVNGTLKTGEVHKMSATLSYVLRMVTEIERATAGMFDVATAPAASFLKSFVAQHKRLPETDTELTEFRAHEAYSSMPSGFTLDFKAGTLVKRNDRAEMDLGGCSKGYCVDLVVERLCEAGHTDCLFEWGGEIRAAGRPMNNAWKVGIMRPPALDDILTFDRTKLPLLHVIELHDEALATSGDYENLIPETKFSKLYETRFHRLLTPTTKELAQVTVKCPSALFADICATAAFLKRDFAFARRFLDLVARGRFPIRDFTLYVRHEERMACMHERATETRELREKRLANSLPAKVIVVGAGLAGLSAAIEAANCGAAVILLDKAPRIGGNSAKATSGINGWGTDAQGAMGVSDNGKYFERDTYFSGKGGATNTGMVRMLSVKSAEAIRWLRTTFDLPLSVVSQLGGHSRPRTHRVPDQPDGTPVPVGYRIIESLQKHIETKLKGRVAIMTDTQVVSLITTEGADPHGTMRKHVRGVMYQNSDNPHPVELLADAVILATGGFASDMSDTSLLKEFTPQLVGIPTTNGDFATGDGMKMAREIGASLIDMDKVQLHPTGFINPKDPNNNTKFLGPEALRGSGGILLNNKGERFVNELDLRSKVSAAIQAQGNVYPNTQCKFAHCVLNVAAMKKFGPSALNFYKDKIGLFQDAATTADLAAIIGCSEEAIVKTLNEYSESCKRGVCPKTHKQVFPVPVTTEGPFVIAAISPVLHYCMGGVMISPAAEVQVYNDVGPSVGRGHSILGLLAAGEVTGGVHGRNRLGGNSLLECVVFGRIAGDRAATILQKKETALASDNWNTVVVREVREGGSYGQGSAIIRFNLPGACQLSGLQIGQFVAIRGEFDGQELMGFYSPITLPNDHGVIGILCRIDKGNLKDWLRAMQPGDAVEMRACGGLVIERVPSIPALVFDNTPLRSIVMIAGGSGVAPMIQIIRGAIKPPYYDAIEHLSLIYSAENVEELTYNDVLRSLAESYPKLNTHYVLNNPPQGWTEGVGFVDKDVLLQQVPPPNEHQLIVICGPLPMQRAMWHTLSSLGHDTRKIKFIDGSDGEMAVRQKL
eukprot:PhM_4_TR10474/c0_g1_i3/m.69464